MRKMYSELSWKRFFNACLVTNNDNNSSPRFGLTLRAPNWRCEWARALNRSRSERRRTVPTTCQPQRQSSIAALSNLSSLSIKPFHCDRFHRKFSIKSKKSLRCFASIVSLDKLPHLRPLSASVTSGLCFWAYPLMYQWVALAPPLLAKSAFQSNAKHVVLATLRFWTSNRCH